MNWVLLVLTAYAAVVLEAGLQPALAIGTVAPSFVLVLAAYVGLKAPAAVVPWVFLALGLVQDLREPIGIGEGQTVALVGPMGLGYLAGAAAVLGLRGMVLRDSTLALVALAFVAGIFVQLVATALLTLRGLAIVPAEPVVGWSAADALVGGFLELVYTAVAALPIGLLLIRSTKWWGFTGRSHF